VWGVFWAQASPGPRDWVSGNPIAWLAAGASHWSWVWADPGMPGIMYSAPTSPRFNGFDLYAMGLMTFEEAGGLAYRLSGAVADITLEPLSEVTVDDLLFSLSLSGPAMYEGDGRRVPPIDGDVSSLLALIVVIKGQDDDFTSEQLRLIRKLALELPLDWHHATWGRSSMTVALCDPSQSDWDADGVADCIDNCPYDQNLRQLDRDTDGVGDRCDQCPGVGDPLQFNADERPGLDLRDLANVLQCVGRPEPAAGFCTFSDFDGNERVDLTDFRLVPKSMTGPCGAD
jgi:hypothetical protein